MHSVFKADDGSWNVWFYATNDATAWYKIAGPFSTQAAAAAYASYLNGGAVAPA